MRLIRILLAMMFFFGLAALMLHACAPGIASGTDPVVPDTYTPPTLQVTVNINEVQDASNGINGTSEVNLQFMTNEIKPSQFVTFNNQEYIICNGIKLYLANFGSSVTTFSVHMNIPSDPPGYTCAYYYSLNEPPTTIFSTHVLNQLNPLLYRPVSNSSDISVSYNYDNNQSDCHIQATANTPNGNATGPTVVDGSTTANGNGVYPGPNDSSLNVGSLSGEGNLVMTRTCVPPNEQFDHQNKADDGCQCTDSSLQFDKLNVTYKSTASAEVYWVPSNTPATSAS
jgi:hypothetical protein